MAKLTRRIRRTYRQVFGRGTTLERKIAERREQRVRTVDHGNSIERRNRNSVVIESKSGHDPVRGIYLYGACDVSTLFEMVPMIAPNVTGTTGMLSMGHVSFTRADMLLQTLGDLPTDLCDEIVTKFQLDPHYFEPDLFAPTFEIPGHDQVFDKDAIVLSIGPSLVRTAYRHRKHDVLVDPGGWWLADSVNTVRNDPETMAWFQREFVTAGRLTPEAWATAFEQVVAELRRQTDAEIVVFNTLTVEPGDPTHSYAHRRRPEGIRRRRYLIALTEMSRRLGVHVVDTDRVLKGVGIQDQVDFAHYPNSRGSLAVETHRVLHDLGIV